MSYILDALRRADAERGRGAVPGLHARPLSAEPLVDEVAGARRVPWAVMAAVGSVGVLALAAWLWWPRPPVVPAPVVISAAPAPAPAPAPVIVPAPPPLPLPLAPPAVVEQPPAAVGAPAPAAVPAPTPAPTPTPRAEKPAAAPTPTAKPAPPKEPAGPPATPLAQVPPEVKSQLPPINIGGSIYSNNADSRFVMINGQVVREGEPAATGMVLERIGPKSAILRWREWRIEVPL